MSIIRQIEKHLEALWINDSEAYIYVLCVPPDVAVELYKESYVQGDKACTNFGSITMRINRDMFPGTFCFVKSARRERQG